MAGPDAVRRTIADAGPVADAIAHRLRERGTRRVFVIGNGTSLWSSRWICEWYRYRAAPDDPMMVPISAAAFRFYRPPLGASDAVVAISASGEFRDVVASAADLQGIVPVVAVVQVADSALGRVAGEVVVAAGGPSSMPVMTRTFLSTATAGALVALGLLRDPDSAGAGRRELDQAADAAEAAIASAARVVEGLALELRDLEHAFVVGGGAAAIAAGEGALKLTEMALLHAEGVETWEAESGIATILGPGSFVVAIHPAGPAAEATAALAVNASGWGARVIEVAPERAARDAALLPVPADAPEAAAPLFAVPPVALLAYHLAVARGRTPDRPDWVSRYAAQGLHHVAGAR